jgi:hypothetical protein
MFDEATQQSETIKVRRLKKQVLWPPAKQTKSSELGISTSEAHSPTKVHSLALDPIHWLMNKDRKRRNFHLRNLKITNEPLYPFLTLAKKTSRKIAGFSRPFNYTLIIPLTTLEKILPGEDIKFYWKRLHVCNFALN